MTAMVTVLNEGPDELEIQIGDRSFVVPPGSPIRFSTNKRPIFRPIPPLTAAERAYHEGLPLDAVRNDPPLRHVDAE